MGCFYTLTPELITKLGFFDESSFPVGAIHISIIRLELVGLRQMTQFLFDMVDSKEFIGMVLKDGYKRTFRTLSVKEMHSTTSENELAFREAVLLTENRIYVPRGW